MPDIFARLSTGAIFVNKRLQTPTFIGVIAFLVIVKLLSGSEEPSQASVSTPTTIEVPNATMLPAHTPGRPPTRLPPTHTPTPIPLPTNTPALVMVKTINAANLRGGPGTDYPIINTIQAGTILTITARTDAGDWYFVQDGTWIAGFLLESAPVVPPIPPTPTPTVTPRPPTLTEAQYGKFLTNWMDRFGPALEQLGELTITPGENFAGIADEMISLESELHTILPPFNYINFHGLLTTTLGSCRDAAVAMRDGDVGMARIYFPICKTGLELAIDKLDREH